LFFVLLIDKLIFIILII